MKKTLLIITFLTLSIGLFSSCAVRQLDTRTEKFYNTYYSRDIKGDRNHRGAVFVKYDETYGYSVFITQSDPKELLWAIDLGGDFVTDVIMTCLIGSDGETIIHEGVYRNNYKDIYSGEELKFMETGFEVCDKLMKKGHRRMTHDMRFIN